MLSRPRAHDPLPHPRRAQPDSSRPTAPYPNHQSVLISGESGAGKTETTKRCLQFFAQAGAQASNGGAAEGDDASEQIPNKILSSSPLLEAFGNAKTLRNDNSSRFGKWMVVHFGDDRAAIVGCSIENYLLEKSRVVTQEAGERNYHSFYQTMCGLPDDELEALHLKSMQMSQFHVMNQSGCYHLRAADDADECREMLNAVEMLSFTSEERTWMFRIVAAVLYLGNVEFESNGTEGSNILNEDVSSKVADLLQCPETELGNGLVKKTFTAGRRGSVNTVLLNPEQAREGSGALAKMLYSQLFNWLVARVNTNLAPTEQVANSVGVLDIFGYGANLSFRLPRYPSVPPPRPTFLLTHRFEIFEVNSFEQLCINFANEALQKHFNANVFTEEINLYEREGIEIPPISFEDNQVSQTPCSVYDTQP